MVMGRCGRKHPPPAPPELPGIPRFSQQELGVGRGLGLAALAHALVSEQPVRAGEALRGQGGVSSGAGGGAVNPRNSHGHSLGNTCMQRSHW